MGENQLSSDERPPWKNLIHEFTNDVLNFYELTNERRMVGIKKMILSIHESKMSHFSVFTNSRAIFLLLTSHERHCFYESTKDFFLLTNSRKKKPAGTNTTRGGGLMDLVDQIGLI